MRSRTSSNLPFPKDEEKIFVLRTSCFSDEQSEQSVAFGSVKRGLSLLLQFARCFATKAGTSIPNKPYSQVRATHDTHILNNKRRPETFH